MSALEIMLVIIAMNINAVIGNLSLMVSGADPEWIYGEPSWCRWYRAVAGYFIVQLWPLWLVTHCLRGFP